jgi:ABC-type multidrug transport system permease subunit
MSFGSHSQYSWFYLLASWITFLPMVFVDTGFLCIFTCMFEGMVCKMDEWIAFGSFSDAAVSALLRRRKKGFAETTN